MSSIVNANDANFEAEVLTSTGPVLVDFSAVWCGPCKRLEPIVHEIAAEYGDRLKVVKVDVDHAPGIAAKFGVLSDPDADDLQRRPGQGPVHRRALEAGARGSGQQGPLTWEGCLETINGWGFALSETLKAQLQSGSISAVFVVFAAGVLTSFTPCVYPMIPVTVTYIGGAAGGNRRRAVGLSVTYVLGLAVMYAALGIAAAMLGKIFGEFTRNPWVFAAVGLIIAGLGLAMLDVFTIPALMTGLQGQGARRGGFLGRRVDGGRRRVRRGAVHRAGSGAAPCLCRADTRCCVGGLAPVRLRARAGASVDAARDLLGASGQPPEGGRLDGPDQEGIRRRDVGDRSRVPLEGDRPMEAYARRRVTGVRAMLARPRRSRCSRRSRSRAEAPRVDPDVPHGDRPGDRRPRSPSIPRRVRCTSFSSRPGAVPASPRFPSSPISKTDGRPTAIACSSSRSRRGRPPSGCESSRPRGRFPDGSLFDAERLRGGRVRRRDDPDAGARRSTRTHRRPLGLARSGVHPGRRAPRAAGRARQAVSPQAARRAAVRRGLGRARGLAGVGPRRRGRPRSGAIRDRSPGHRRATGAGSIPRNPRASCFRMPSGSRRRRRRRAARRRSGVRRALEARPRFRGTADSHRRRVFRRPRLGRRRWADSRAPRARRDPVCRRGRLGVRGRDGQAGRQGAVSGARTSGRAVAVAAEARLAARAAAREERGSSRSSASRCS